MELKKSSLTKLRIKKIYSTPTNITIKKPHLVHLLSLPKIKTKTILQIKLKTRMANDIPFLSISPIHSPSMFLLLNTKGDYLKQATS
jgi:hypothetical protein